MTVDIKRGRAICDAASPAPWSVDPFEYRADGEQKYFPSLRLHSEGPFNGRLTINVSQRQQMDQINATAIFMAESRQMLPDALDEIETLRAALISVCCLAREAMERSPRHDQKGREYILRLNALIAHTISDEQIRELMERPSTTQELQALCQTALWSATKEHEPDRTIARTRVAKIYYRELGSALSW